MQQRASQPSINSQTNIALDDKVSFSNTLFHLRNATVVVPLKFNFVIIYSCKSVVPSFADQDLRDKTGQEFEVHMIIKYTLTKFVWFLSMGTFWNTWSDIQFTKFEFLLIFWKGYWLHVKEWLLCESGQYLLQHFVGGANIAHRKRSYHEMKSRWVLMLWRLWF